MRLDEDLKYFEDPEFKKILAEYEAAREVGESLYMDADELTDIAEYYALVVNDEKSSNEVIDFALLLHPDAVDPQIFKARQYMLKGDHDKARELCDAIPDQHHREVHFLRAELLVRENKSEEAFSILYHVAYTINEDRDFFLFDSAYIFIDYQQYDWALAFANKLEEMAPNWYKTWQLQADVQLGLENNRVALTYIERMLDVDPFYVETWNWSAEAHSNLGEFNEAVESTDYALAIDPENERSLQLKAWVLMQQGNSEEAHQLYEHLQSINPGNEQHFLYDSYCLLDAERLDESLKMVVKAEEMAGEDCIDQQAIYEQHAQVLSRLGDVQGALQYLDRAEKAKTGDAKRGSDKSMDDRLLRARVYLENNLFEKASSYMTDLGNELQNDPNQLFKLFKQFIGLVFDYGYYEEVVKFLEQKLDVYGVYDKDSDGEYFTYLAYSHMMLEHPEATLKYLRKAIVAGAPNLAEIFADAFPNVPANELYDYYYYKVYGCWPDSH